MSRRREVVLEDGGRSGRGSVRQRKLSGRSASNKSSSAAWKENTCSRESR